MMEVDERRPDGALDDCGCPADPRIARFFDRRAATRRAKSERYAMGAVSKILLEALRRQGPAGRSILELGCGPGAMLTELLLEGATSATGVDLSAEALAEARQRTREAGVAERAAFQNADAARARLEQHDWVVLDKVICCYPEPDALLDNAIPAAGRLFGFAVPASYGLRGLAARLSFGLEYLALRVVGRPCPGYVHDLAAIEERLRRAGFDRSFVTHRTLWHIAIFERPSATGAGRTSTARA